MFKRHAPSQKQKKAPAKKPTRDSLAQRAIQSHRVARLLTSAEGGPYIMRLSVRVAGAFTSDGAGKLNQGIHVNSPSVVIGSTVADWSPNASLFDQYKVIWCQVAFYPSSTMNQLGSGTTYSPVHMLYDADSTVAIASVDAAVQYDNRRTFNLFRPFVYKCKVKTATDNSVSNSGMQITTDKKYGPLLDIAEVANYQKGIITWYADNLPVTTNFGDLVIDFSVLFFNRR